MAFVKEKLHPRITAKLRQIPFYPIDVPGLERGLRFINRPVLRWPEVESLSTNSTRVFVTGHIIDKAGQTPRFPDTDLAIDTAARRVHEKLDEIHRQAEANNKKLELVFCSGAAGMDLLSLEWAVAKIENARAEGREPDISIRVFLPFGADAFREHSVDYGEHAERWTKTFDYLKENGHIVEPEFRREVVRRQVELTVSGVKEEIKNRYGDSENHYKEYDELNDKMVAMLRRGDYVLALWDGKEPRGRGGTIDAICKAHRRIGDPTHVMFVDDPLILPNRAEGERSMTEVLVVKRRWKNSFTD